MSAPRNPNTAALEALIEAHAIELKLPTVRRRFRALAAEALREQQTPIAYLGALLEAEMAERAERREKRRLIDARFPQIKRLEDFRFQDNPKVPQATIAALAEGSWIDDRESVIFIGDSDPVSHCPPRCRHWSNSPAPLPDTWILRPFRRPLVTWTACKLAALDLVQNGLAGAPEPLGGLVQRQVAVGNVGHEPGADLVGQPDPPRRVRGGLLARQQAGAQPPVDRGVVTPSSPAACSIVHRSLSGSGGGAARISCLLADALDTRLGERQAGAGAAALLVEDRGDLTGRGCARRAGGSARLCPPAVRVLSTPRCTSGTVSWVRAPPSQQISTSARRGSSVDGHDDLADQRAQQLLAVAVGGRLGRPQPREVAGDPPERLTLGGCERLGPAALELGELAPLALELAERGLERRFERAGDEPVLRLARVVLPLRAVGFELGALDRESLAGEPLLVLLARAPRSPVRRRGSRPG